MTEKESAHPLSPSANVDIGKCIKNRESNAEPAEEEPINTTKNSVIPVRKETMCRVALLPDYFVRVTIIEVYIRLCRREASVCLSKPTPTMLTT